MLPKIAFSMAPLALYALAVAVLALRGRTPSRMALNVHISLLLLAYLLTTAGLGIFWVANQQLPVFDWHYLFGYGTLLLVGLHLVFNLPIVVRWMSRSAGKPAPAAGGMRTAGNVLAVVLALGIAYYIGTRQGGGEVQLSAGNGAAQSVVQYHEYSSESRARVFRRAPGVSWGEAPPPFKHYPSARKIPLQKGQPGGAGLTQALAAVVPRAGPPSLADVGRLMYLSAGVTQRRGGHALRAAPSSGALFPSELYLIVRRVAGLESGLYHYDPDGHRLALLGPPPAGLGDADLTVALTAVFRRTGYKYHNRAYRYALADAGHLLENTRLAARAMGLHATLLHQFDDVAAAKALQIDGIEEGVLALMPLHSGAAAPAGPWLVAAPVSDGGAIGVTGAVHQATSLYAAGDTPGPALALPAPTPLARDLHSVIVARRSQRRFDGAPLALADLSSILADVRQSPQLSAALEVNVVVNRVAGLAPGVYRYGPGHVLRLLRSGQFGGAAQSAALSQDVIGDAAAVLVLSADRERVLAHGPRGYRHALIEAGLMSERWLLSAVGRGLGACPVGAFYDDEAAALLGADPRRHWVLHFAALGVPG